MRVEIVSVYAALAGRESIVWVGDVEPDAELDRLARTSGAAFDAHANDWLFRYFNRVDESDNARLEAIGYTLPSLSVGDLVHWASTTWRVSGWGFDRLTGDDGYSVALALYALRTSSDERPSS